MDQFLSNVGTAARDPKILAKWLSWQIARRTGRSPRLRIRASEFEGFPNFSAYLGDWRYRPTDDEMSFIDRAVAGADTILDVGANFGVLTVLFSRLAPEAHIVAFEPSPATRAILMRNVALNACRHVTVVGAAVGERDGTIGFTASADPATNRIATDNSAAVEVPVISLDSYLAENGIDRVDFAKVDVEGAELDLLNGAERTFASRRIARGMIEICPGNLARFGASVGDLTGFFDRHGYRLYFYEPGLDPALLCRGAALPERFLINAAFERVNG